MARGIWKQFTMCNEKFLFGCFRKNASFWMKINGGRGPVPRCFGFMHFPVRVLVVSSLFSPLTDWYLNSLLKNGPKDFSLFWKALPAFNFSCFEAHSFPMAVLVRTGRCVTVGWRGQYRKYLTELAGYFARCSCSFSVYVRRPKAWCVVIRSTSTL